MSPQEWIELLANLFIFAGALTITVSPRLSLKPQLFYFFLAGHICWTIAGLTCYDPWQWRIVMLNGIFVFVDIYAIYIRIKMKAEI